MTRQYLPKNCETFYDIINVYNEDKKNIIISDVDGILTSGILGYTKNGKTIKYFGGHDKECIDICVNKLGWDLLFVTDDKIGWNITKSRLSHIKKINTSKIDYKIANSKERFELVKFYKQLGFNVLFIGDSISDISSLNVANISATTNNALDITKKYVDYVSPLNGGNGGFAEILFELIIKKQLNIV